MLPPIVAVPRKEDGNNPQRVKSMRETQTGFTIRPRTVQTRCVLGSDSSRQLPPATWRPAGSAFEKRGQRTGSEQASLFCRTGPPTGADIQPCGRHVALAFDFDNVGQRTRNRRPTLLMRMSRNRTTVSKAVAWALHHTIRREFQRPDPCAQ